MFSFSGCKITHIIYIRAYPNRWKDNQFLGFCATNERIERTVCEIHGLYYVSKSNPKVVVEKKKKASKAYKGYLK